VSPRGRRDSGSRSEDDRQRARLEREQRRARREGRPIPRTLDDLDPTAGLTDDHAALGGAAFGVPGGFSGDDVPAPPGAPSAPPASASQVAGPRSADPGAPASGPAGVPAPQPEQPPAAFRTEPTARGKEPRSAEPRPAEPRPSQDPPDASRPAPSAAPPATAAANQPWWATAAQDTPPAPAAPAVPPRGQTDPSRPQAPAAPPRPAEPPATPPQAPEPPATPLRPEPPRGAPDPSVPDPAPQAARPVPRHDAPPPAESVPAPPRGGGAPERTVDEWFPDETGDHTADRTGGFTDDHTGGFTDGHTGEHAAAGGGGTPLVPLKPAGPAPRAGVAPATVKARTAPARRGVSRIAAVLVLVPIVLAVVGAYLLFEPGKGGGEGTVRVRIPEGSSVSDIGTLLQEKGVIANPVAFAIRARISGSGANLKAGTLRLKKDMSYGAALTALQQDPLPPSVVSVGLPEGLSRREAAAAVKKAGLKGSYLTASARSKGFDPQDYGQPRSRSGLEGFLFPATYELPKGGATAKALVAKQVAAFAENVRQVDFDRAKRAKLSRYDVLIIASMIEREVRVPSERKLVAAVIWNRLKDGMALGIDATTRYAVRNWTRPLTQSEIDRDTPYDTRRKVGLPPTPIGSPGLAAIKAAANPANVSYRWYVVKPCGAGRHSFASTSAKFDQDRDAYVVAQKRANGDPSDPDAPGCK
jgi:uncharacterized YceG family protein